MGAYAFFAQDRKAVIGNNSCNDYNECKWNGGFIGDNCCDRRRA